MRTTRRGIDQMHRVPQLTFFITTPSSFNQKQRDIYKHSNHEKNK